VRSYTSKRQAIGQATQRQDIPHASTTNPIRTQKDTPGTPFNAILLQSSWAIVLILFWDTFNDLITYVVFMDLLFMVLAAISIFIFRKKLATTNRPYRTLGYPIIPIIYIAISTIFVINTLIEKPTQAFAGLGLTLIGFGFYWYFKNNVSSEK
jgi:APA family basic amino acid/polyamine antiporter